MIIHIQQIGDPQKNDSSPISSAILGKRLNSLTGDKFSLNTDNITAFAAFMRGKDISAAILARAKHDFGTFYAMLWTIDGIDDFFPLNDTIEVPFQEFKNKVMGFINATGVAESEVGIKFYHRLDPASNKWFLTMEMCKLTAVKPASVPPVYDVMPFPAFRYDIIGSSAPVISSFTGSSDAQYFSYVYYFDYVTGTYNQVNTTDHVNSIIFPWYSEIRLLAEQNGLYNDANAVLAFCSCSFQLNAPDIGVIANVEWPHEIVMHMKNGTYNCLGVNDPVIGPFNNSGADIGGLCPPNCNTYTG